jgi:hypothetical protein
MQHEPLWVTWVLDLRTAGHRLHNQRQAQPLALSGNFRVARNLTSLEFGIAGTNHEEGNHRVSAASNGVFRTGYKATPKRARRTGCKSGRPVEPGDEGWHIPRRTGLCEVSNHAKVEKNGISSGIHEALNLFPWIFCPRNWTVNERMVKGDYKTAMVGVEETIKANLLSVMVQADLAMKQLLPSLTPASYGFWSVRRSS